MTALTETFSSSPTLAPVTASGTAASDLPPLLLLSAALDDPHVGHVIFDSALQLIHVTSRTASLLDLQPQAPAESATVLQLLTRSSFDETSLEEAKRRIAEFTGEHPETSFLLHTTDRTRYLRVRLRSIAEHYRIASFEPVAAEAEKKLIGNDFSLRDSLTGLASRHYFEEMLTKVLSRVPKVAVTLLLIDLERLKAVNDTLGYSAGDAVLRLAAERLKATVRKEDLVARLDGDEFAVLMSPSASVAETKGIAERILDLVQRTYLIQGQLVNIGVSIGIGQAPGDGNDAASLLRSADLALYRSKSSGRATYHFFEEQMLREAQARRTSELELRRALSLRQLELFYQPQVDAANTRILGFEALLRWRHPEKGIIPPGDFLPIAEEIGAIVPIGDWVLRTACREALKWPAYTTVAVNASPLQFETGNFAESVKRALAGSGLPGERLEIEITEGIMLRYDEAIMKTLQELRAMKVRIAMDDFGTGYASLSQLARFPFDKIKIDRSLISFAGSNAKHRSIVRAITSLGQSLGVGILAEGVEDAQQLARLQSDGCTAFQGYYYSRPVPTSQIQEILGRFSPAS